MCEHCQTVEIYGVHRHEYGCPHYEAQQAQLYPVRTWCARHKAWIWGVIIVAFVAWAAFGPDSAYWTDCGTCDYSGYPG